MVRRIRHDGFVKDDGCLTLRKSIKAARGSLTDGDGRRGRGEKLLHIFQMLMKKSVITRQ
jgi:hypothetical protein